jgi:crotonobetainyl-CoA:carnitine CoA-transferase CaiB-like acyl-CoA transferase
MSVCDVGTGYAATLVTAALLERERTGRGRRLDRLPFSGLTSEVGPGGERHAER